MRNRFGEGEADDEDDGVAAVTTKHSHKGWKRMQDVRPSLSARRVLQS